MSRCFPYPPPGYENKARDDRVNLLAKQENGERKHKKGKRNKEKKEGKERKDKDRSKDKQKEKKHQKGKHKEDKKKKKDKDKGGNRTSDDLTENYIQFQHGDRLEGSHKTKEISTKLIDELDDQIRHGGKVKMNRGVDNFSCPVLRSFDGSSAEALQVINTGSEVISSSTDIFPRGINKVSVCNFSGPIQSHAEVLESGNAVEKERIKVRKLVSDLTHLEQRGTDGKKQPVGNATPTVRQTSNGQGATGMEKENCKQSKFVQIPNGTLQKPFNGMVQSPQSTSPFAPGKFDGLGLAKKTKERDVKKVLQDHISVEQRTADSVDQSIVRNACRRIEGKEKNRDEVANGKNEKPTERSWNYSKKEKDKARVKEKGMKQAKIREKCELINRGFSQRIRDICEKDQIHSPNLALLDYQRDQKGNSSHTVNKKRKVLEINGLHDNILPPNKLQRRTRTPSSDNLENETAVNNSSNFSSTIQDHDEVIEFANVLQKERKIVNRFSDLTHHGERGNGCNKQPVDNSTITIQQRFDGPYFSSEFEKEKRKENKVAQNPNNMVQRSFNGVRSAESTSIIAPRKVGIAKTTEERGDIKEVSPNHIGVQKRVNDGISQLSEKDADRQTQGKEDREGEAFGKNEKHGDSDLDKKKNGKDNIGTVQDTGKELTEIRGKCDEIHNECIEISDTSKMDQVHNPNTELFDFWRDQRRNSNNDQNKNKEITTNGALRENASLPNKFRSVTPSWHVQNERTVDSYDDAHSSVADERINIRAQKTLLGKKEQIVNNTSVTQSSSDSSRHPVHIDNARSKACQKPPHPDSKYLSEIYSVPKMYDLPVFDEEWLFSSYQLQSKLKHEVTEISHVWAKALRIGAEDVLALPYVIPL